MSPVFWVMAGWLVVTPVQTHEVSVWGISVGHQEFSSRTACEETTRIFAKEATLFTDEDHPRRGEVLIHGREVGMVLPVFPESSVSWNPNGPGIQPICELIDVRIPKPWRLAAWLVVGPEKTVAVHVTDVESRRYKTKTECFDNAGVRESLATMPDLSPDKTIERQRIPRGVEEEFTRRVLDEMNKPGKPELYASPWQEHQIEPGYRPRIRAFCVKFDPEGGI